MICVDFIISQILGGIVSVAAMLSMQFKKLKFILICQLVCNVVGSVSYLLLDGGLSGFGIYIIALAQTIVFFVIRNSERSAPSYLGYVFAFAFLICSISTYSNYNDLFSLAAAQTCAFALSQEKSSNYRLLMLLNGFIWILYDVNVQAYTMIVSHAITAVSALIGIIRLDIKKNSSGNSKEIAND